MFRIKKVLPLNAWIGNRIKTYALAWDDCPKSEGLQRRLNCKVRCSKGEWIRSLSISRSFRLLQTTDSPVIGICKLFSCSPKQHMLFWLLKDAWLTYNRCSFRALPTPFWGPIRHLFETAWQPIDLLLIADLFFCTCFLYLLMIYLKLCNGFSKACLCFQPIKMKRLLFRRRITG